MDDANLGLLDARRSSSRGDDVLVQQDTIHELGIIDGAADLLDEANVAEVDVGGGRSDEAEDRVDGDRGEDGRVLRDNLCRRARGSARVEGRPTRRKGRCETHLGAQTGAGGPQQTLAVGEVDGCRHLGEVLDDLGGGAAERLGDDGRVDALGQQLLGGAQEGSSENDDRRGTISCLDILRC